jgi:hypothetical protein
MNIRKIKTLLGQNLNNIRGWSSNRKIIVIESDDWGAIRMPSKNVFEVLRNQGIDVHKCDFCKYDSLASESDLKLLFEVLLSHKTKNNKHPVITANTIVANPDFDKIKASNFEKYYYEIFTDTLSSYSEHSNVFDYWKYGIQMGIFKPQLHGREHLNVELWMKNLRNNSEETMFAFDNKMYGISSEISKEDRKSYMAALNFQDSSEIEYQKTILREAQDIFLQKFGIKSKSFIAPNYVWSPQIEETLKDIGVEFIQSSRNQILPDAELRKIKKIRHFTGQRNKYNQIYLVRNCIFEPATSKTKNHVDDCLGQIEASFRWKKPAIIASHRLNYIGYIDENNRNRNLSLFDNLLKRIIEKWPDVEFMSSDELGELIKYDIND